jgi:DMSO/TMAO reductase YedYZ molybdopterin-dependent catalytic subunit
MRFKFFSFMVLFALALAACAAPPTPAPTAIPPTPVPPTAVPPTVAPTATQAPAVLTQTGAQGTKTLTLDDIKKLPATEGQAGIKSSTGKITPPALFKGVLITDLVKEIGGLDATMGVQLEAKDGYAMTYSADQVMNGTFVAYDPSSGDETRSAGQLRTLLAYEMDGKPLDVERDGQLRLVIISEKNNQVTDGHWSVKWVTQVTVKPMAEEWALHLEGAIKEDIDRGTFESCTAAKCHQAKTTDTKSQEWTGVPLYLLVGRVDDEVKHNGPAFNDSVADAGYTVELIARDGYSVTLDSARIKRNKEIIVASLMNGNTLVDKDFPLKLVGTDLSKKEGVGAIAKIIVHLNGKAAAAPTATAEPSAATPAPTQAGSGAGTGGAALTLTGLVGKEQAWSLDDLQKMEVVKLTVEHPKKGKQDAEGVRLNALLDLAQPKADARALVITAIDGYTAEVDLKAVRACADCLIAFNQSAGLKTVMPGMQGNLWVKDVVKIEIK